MLVVNADEVEHRSVPRELCRRLPEEAHTVPLKQLLCLVFNSGINFVIAVAAPYAERRFQKREFRDARLERVAVTCDEVSSNDGEMCSKVVGHGDGTAEFARRERVANVGVAELHDTKAIKCFGKIGYR